MSFYNTIYKDDEACDVEEKNGAARRRREKAAWII